MFTESLKKKVAKLLLTAMLFCNVSPAFAMQAVSPDYQVNIERRNVLDQVTGTVRPSMLIEAFKLTEQVVEGVANLVYQTVFTQTVFLMTALAKATVGATRFVDIEGLGRVRLDENDTIIVDRVYDSAKTVAFTTDRSVIIDSLACNALNIIAPNVTTRGKTHIQSLEVSILGENGIFAIGEGSFLTTQRAVIDGKVFNCGTWKFLEAGTLLSDGSSLHNNGIISGDSFSLQNIGFCANAGTILGQHINLQSNILFNDGKLGAVNSDLDLLVHKSFVNNSELLGKSAKIVLTSEGRSFLNQGHIGITEADLQISGLFRNEGESAFGKLTGFVSTLFNKGKLKSKSGSLTVDSGENHHILKLASLVSDGNFVNTFTDSSSVMRIKSMLGSGTLFNKSAMFGIEAIGIRGFYNQNSEFVTRYGCSSFGNAIRFLSSLGKIVNEGILEAGSVFFEDTDAAVENARTAVIKTSQEMKGKVGRFDNFGSVQSTDSYISMTFDTCVNRGKFAATKGVSFKGDTLRNYSDLSLHSSQIAHLFNGESIIDEIDDAFFAGVERTISLTAQEVSAMPLEQRKEVIADILQKAKSMNMLQEQVKLLQDYFDVLNTAPPAYSPESFPLPRPASYTSVMSMGQNINYVQCAGYIPQLKAAILAIPAHYRGSLEARANTTLGDGTVRGARGFVILRNFRAILPDVKAALQATEKEELEKDYHRKLAKVPAPLAELAKIISVYNKHSIPKTAANLWMYFGSSIGRLENTGHIEFIKGRHTIDTYMGTAKSEFLLPEVEGLPDYTDVITGFAAPRGAQVSVQYSGKTTEEDACSEPCDTTRHEQIAESFLSIPDPETKVQAIRSFLQTVSTQTPEVLEAIERVNAYLMHLPPSDYWLVFSAPSNPYTISAGWEHWDGYATKFVRQFRDPLDFGGHYIQDDNYVTNHPSFGNFVRAKKQELLDRISHPFLDIKADLTGLIAKHYELARGKAQKYRTLVSEKKLEGAGKIQAIKIKVSDFALTDSFSFLTDELETTAAGFANDKDIVLPRTKLIFDLLMGDFENIGNIACLGFLIRNCGIFRNKNRIETYADIDVTAKQVLNIGKPTICKKSTSSAPSNNSYGFSHGGRAKYPLKYLWVGWFNSGGMSPVPNDFNFYSVGNGVLRSHTGKIILNGEELVRNEYSSIIASNGFTLASALGKVENYVGNIFSIGNVISTIQAKSFEHLCRAPEDIVTGTCWLQHDNAPAHYSSMYATFNTSDKPKIFSGGDLRITVCQTPIIRGGDISSGGSIISEFPGASFKAEQVNLLIPEIKAHEQILVNGHDIGIKGALFLAGFGIGLSATGEIIVVNPSGQQYIIPPKGSLDINVGELARKSYRQMLTAPVLEHDFGIAPIYHMSIDPTAGMRRLFLGNAPDPMKRLVFDTRIMSALPMIFGDYATLLGTQTLNTPRFLSLLDGNARELDGTLIPANQMPNKMLMYFTVKDIDDETQEAEPHIHIPVEAFSTLRNRFAIESEQGPVIMQGSTIDLKNVVLSGTSVELIARKDPAAITSTGRISMMASKVTATKDKLHIHADEGTRATGRYDVTGHLYAIDGGEAYVETAMHEPTVLQAPKIVISGGESEIRGTLVKAKTFADETERLIIGVDKALLRYWSHAEKSRGFFGDVSITHTGWHEIGVPTMLCVEKMLSSGGNSLEFESVIMNGAKLLVQKPIFRESVATLHSHDEVKTTSSGISFGGKASISDPLANAWQNLIHSPNAKALAGSAISTAATIMGSAEDAGRLFDAVTSGISLDTASIIAGTLAKRLVNIGFSIGTTATKTVSHQTQQLPNRISAELIKLDCPTSIHLQGEHFAREFIAETETFTTSDIVSTSRAESETKGSSFSFNPISAVVGCLPGMNLGVGAALAGASSVSVTNVSQHQHELRRAPTTVTADRFILRAGNLHLTDTQIRARLVDAIIRDDLVIESLTDEFFNESKGGSFGIGLGFIGLSQGIKSMSDVARATSGMSGSVVDVREVERKINAFASLVGEERFNLTVGGTLLAKSAFYGQMDEGRTVTAPRMSETSTNPRERIEVGRAVHEIVQEEHSRRDGSYTIPLGDLLTVMSTLTPREEIAKAVTEEGLEKGLTHGQIREKKAKAVARLDAEKDRAGSVSDKIDETDKQFVRELESSVSPSEIQALRDGKPVSAETKQAIRTAAQKAKNTHVRERTTMDLKRSKDVSENVESQISEGSLNACLGFYDGRIDWYEGLLNSVCTETQSVTRGRRNSFDLRVPTTISGMEDTVKEAGSRFMADSRMVRAKGFTKAWESGETAEYLGRTTASVLVDDVIPVIGKGVQNVDRWTRGVLSTALSAVDPSTWGTGVRRGLRDGIGTTQRFAQNAGDVVQYAGEVGLLLCTFGGGTTVKGAKIAEATCATTKAKRLAQFENVVKEGIGPYKIVKGHHPMQGAAFKGHPMYSYEEALAGGNKWLAKFGDPEKVHRIINTEQRILQKELKLSGRPNTMSEQVRISWQAMERAGIPRAEARSITARAFWDLRAKGVKQPTMLPWGGKK